MKTLLSFVIPCYRSELTIEKVIDEIIETVSQRSDEYDYEIICVNDCSPDNVYDILKRIAAQNTKIKAIDFSRNMGQSAAILAGCKYSSGDYIIRIDDDYQCPIKELWRLLAPVETGECDFATANYYQKKQSAFKNFGSRVNLIMGSVVFGKPKDLIFENFTIMKKFISDEIIKYQNPYPNFEGLVYRSTHKISVVMMHERERGDDKPTGYTFKKSLKLWMNGLTSFSVKPLRFSAILGFVFALLGFICGLIMCIQKLLDPDMPAGYTSLIATQFLIGGINMIMLGMMGEYIGRTYISINNSPQYIIREKINLEKEERIMNDED